MTEAVLTLQIPKGSRFIPVAMTVDPTALIAFKKSVLAEWKFQVLLATDELEAITQQAEYDRLRKVLDLLIPDGNEVNRA
jgi:hypothetical protein